MKIGQKVWCRSAALAGDAEDGKRLRGKIVYIHPRMRYITVELPCGRGVIRECFQPQDVQ